MWTCKKCSESHEDSFDVCWKCGTSKEGIADPTFPRVEGKPTDEQSSEPICVCPICNEPMVVGHISMWGPEGAQLDWTIGPEEFEEDPTIVIRLLESGAILNAGPKRRAHRCMSCGIVTIECEVLKCGYCGRTVPATTKTCACGWTLGDNRWGDT